jgi:hypothetical protein
MSAARSAAAMGPGDARFVLQADVEARRSG